MLTVRDLELRLGARVVLADVGFAVDAGEILAVLGPNGSGKSTLLRAIAGLVAPRAGTIAWGDEALSARGRVLVPPERREIALLMQQAVLFPHLRVDENVALGLDRARAPAEAEARVAAALDRARVRSLARAAVDRLSGGEAQRVALARALVQRPRLLLLDEPFHSLDTPVRAAIIDDLRALVRELGLSVVLVTHDGDEAAALADRVLLLRAGRVVQIGALDELYRAPVDAFAARFLGPVASIDVSLAERVGVALPASIARAAGEIAHFRPEAVALVPMDEPRADDALIVTAVRRRRAVAEITLAIPGGPPLLAHVHGDTSIEVGGRVRARVRWVLPASAAGEP